MLYLQARVGQQWTTINSVCDKENPLLARATLLLFQDMWQHNYGMEAAAFKITNKESTNHAQPTPFVGHQHLAQGRSR